MRRPYQEQYAKGSCVRIASRLVLQQFLRDGKYHSKLQPEQLNYADQFAEVESIGFYHGGDELYELKAFQAFGILNVCCQRQILTSHRTFTVPRRSRA